MHTSYDKEIPFQYAFHKGLKDANRRLYEYELRGKMLTGFNAFLYMILSLEVNSNNEFTVLSCTVYDVMIIVFLFKSSPFFPFWSQLPSSSMFFNFFWSFIWQAFGALWFSPKLCANTVSEAEYLHANIRWEIVYIPPQPLHLGILNGFGLF